MSKIENRRKLFHKFSKQLHLLKDNGLIDIELKFPKTYICPLCLDQFEEADIISSTTKIFLTEEDAPPDKLGGKRIALTCKTCNSTAGHQIDNHLINRIREIDDNSFYNGSSQHRIFDFEGENISAEITSNGDGILKVLHKTKNNNPTLLDKFIYGIKNKTVGPILNLKPKKYNVISDRVDLSLLKTSYIITFSKFGYIFLLDKYYQPMRDQIRNMDNPYETQIFLSHQLQPGNVGTYYVNNPDAKSIFNVFSLKTKYSETIISSILPFPGLTPQEIHANLIKNGEKLAQPGKVGVNLDISYYDNDADLFTDLKEINKILNWK